MKKVVCLLLILFLIGCSNEEKEPEEILNFNMEGTAKDVALQYNIVLKDIDMAFDLTNSPIFIIKNAKGLTKNEFHRVSYFPEIFILLQSGSFSISTLFSLYIFIVFLSVGLHIIFSVIVWPVASFLIGLPSSPFSTWVQPVKVINNTSKTKYFVIFLFFIIISFYSIKNIY